MRKLLSSLMTAATVVPLMATMFNEQLTWNADRFYAPEQELVEHSGKTYSINKEYNALLKQRHTDAKSGVFHEKAHKGNVKALSDFFSLVH